MSLNFLCFKTNRALQPMLEKIKKYDDAYKNILVIIPEHYTLELQKNIIEKTGNGLFNIEFFSPKFLTYNLLEYNIAKNSNILNESGESVLISQIIENNKSSLSFNYDENVKAITTNEIYKIINELYTNNVSPETIDTYIDDTVNNDKKIKWHDINIIYKDFINLIAKKYINSKKSISLLKNKIEKSGYFNNKYIFVYGFDRLNNEIQEITCSLSKVAKEVNVYITMQSNDSHNIYTAIKQDVYNIEQKLITLNINYNIDFFDTNLKSSEEIITLDKILYENSKLQIKDFNNKIRFFESNTPFEEINKVINELKILIEKGINLDNVAIIVPEDDSYKSLLRAHLYNEGILFHDNSSRYMIESEIAKYIVYASKFLTNKYNTNYILRLINNNFCILTLEEKSYLKKYIFQNGIEGNRWHHDFVRNKNMNADKANIIKNKLFDSLKSYEDSINSSKSFSDIIKAIEKLFSYDTNQYLNKAKKTLCKYNLISESNFYNQFWNNIIYILEQIKCIVDNQKIDISKIAEYLEISFVTTKLPPYPPSKNSLTISTPTTILKNNIDHLFILGFSDSIFNINENGFIDEKSLETFMTQSGYSYYNNSSIRDSFNKLHIKRILTLSRKNLYISYSIKDIDSNELKPYQCINLINQKQPNLIKNIENKESIFKKISDIKRDYSNYLNKIKFVNDNIKDKVSIIKEIKSKITVTNNIYERAYSKISPYISKKIYNLSSSSISKVQNFAECPFRYFIDYGIKPDKNEEWEKSKADEGTFFHEILEKIFKKQTIDKIIKSSKDDIYKEAEKIVINSSVLNSDSNFNDSLHAFSDTKILEKKIKQSSYYAIKQVEKTKFNIFLTEYKFDKDTNPDFPIKLNDGSEVQLTGIIDRVDIYENKNSYLRIVDYKSSDKKIDFANIYNGFQLQLIIYMAYLQNKFKDPIPAEIAYFHINNKLKKDIDEQLHYNYMLSSLYNGSKEIQEIIDSYDSPISHGAKFHENGISTDEFKQIIDFSKYKIKSLLEDIKSGNTNIYPLIPQHASSPCEYCKYGYICLSRTKGKRVNKLKKEIFFEKINNELNNNDL